MAFLLKKKKKNHFESSEYVTKTSTRQKCFWGGQCLSGTQLCPSVLGEVDASSEKDGEG